MKKTIILTLVFALMLSTAAYAQENYLYINMDLSTNEVIIDSDYNIQNDFSVDNYMQNIGNEKLFAFSYISETDFNDFKLKIVLPENSIISEKQDVLLISRPFEISTDGTRIYLEWEKELEKDEEFTIFTQYQEKGSDAAYYLALIAIISLISFFIGYKLNIFKKEKFVKGVLSEDEKMAVKIIKNKKEITQSMLKIELGWSKTKTSKILRNLEAKNIIIKKPYKKTNKIKMK